MPKARAAERGAGLSRLLAADAAGEVQHPIAAIAPASKEAPQPRRILRPDAHECANPVESARTPAWGQT